ncbi:DUF4830 domain-containing protein [Flintibacter muris]|uniref:DUF4830 domain-containing protein n=1 Tax=Flintibacter muris TaxID=2941327 RepID=UPI00203A4C53|nr:DUF4830 domain-containing protein [Flintibacter muris]
MLIVTAKMPRRKLTLGVAVAALLCCCAIALNFGQAVGREVSASTLPSPKGIKDNQDRIDYLSAYGWQVSEEPLSTQELLIPQEMDDSYTEYLALQNGQGFDLQKYAGKRVKRYTYEILNYPTGETGVQANLLICKNTVIGGEVLSPQLDGFLHGLAMP